LADTLYPKPEPKNSTAYGTVESVNADGSYQVKLNASATTTRCAKLCDAEVGDRVLVLIQANGHCAAIGRVGGTDLPIRVEDGGTGATTTAAARANIGAMADTADGNTILTGGTEWDGAPIGVFADQITARVEARAPLDTLAARYSESGSYEAGDVVWYTDNIYVCTASTPSPAGAFNPNFWSVVNVASLLSEKQDAISDLATIRAGAADGATAVQPSALPASETWTFVVDDGQGGTTTVTKRVAVYAAQGAGA
jgi:hypothetical protein